VPELALHGGDVTGLLHDVPADGMAGRVRGAAFDLGEPADFVPDRVDRLRGEAARTLRLAVGGEE
jgi:hypothetical protein